MQSLLEQVVLALVRRHPEAMAAILPFLGQVLVLSLPLVAVVVDPGLEPLVIAAVAEVVAQVIPQVLPQELPLKVIMAEQDLETQDRQTIGRVQPEEVEQAVQVAMAPQAVLLQPIQHMVTAEQEKQILY
jgi:hypothetical protein